MKPFTFLAAALLTAPLATGIAFAHHGWSSYDETKPITLTGSLRQVAWGNPHGTAQMKWGGKTWDVILAPVARMEARGLRHAMINRGQPVTITGYARRDGTAEMRLERVKVGNTVVELR